MEEAARAIGHDKFDLGTHQAEVVRSLKTSPSTQSDAPLSEALADLRKVTEGHWIDNEEKP